MFYVALKCIKDKATQKRRIGRSPLGCIYSICVVFHKSLEICSVQNHFCYFATFALQSLNGQIKQFLLHVFTRHFSSKTLYITLFLNGLAVANSTFYVWIIIAVIVVVVNILWFLLGIQLPIGVLELIVAKTQFVLI